MDSSHTTQANMKAGGMAPKPTAKQLRYLRQLAQQTGRTFVTPKTAREASQQIDLLKSGRAATPQQEKAWEALSAKRDRKHISRELQEAPRDAARVREDEIDGWGSGASYTDPWAGELTED